MERRGEAVFRYVPGEVLGWHLDAIIPERLWSAHWTAFDQAVATRQ